MRTPNLLLSCLGVATAVTAREQVHMGNDHQSRYNITLDVSLGLYIVNSTLLFADILLV